MVHYIDTVLALGHIYDSNSNSKPCNKHFKNKFILNIIYPFPCFQWPWTEDRETISICFLKNDLILWNNNIWWNMTQPHTISFFLFVSHSLKKPECNTKYLERHIKKLNKAYKCFTPEIQRELLMIIHETRIVLNVLFVP